MPQQIAILGLNDLEIASEVTPAISSIATPRSEMGRLAGELLVAQTEKRSAYGKRSVDLEFRLIERASTKVS